MVVLYIHNPVPAGGVDGYQSVQSLFLSETTATSMYGLPAFPSQSNAIAEAQMKCSEAAAGVPC